MRSIFHQVVDFHNKLSDLNFIWFPFLFLKLKPPQVMSFWRTCLMTPFFALWYAMNFLFVEWLLGETLSLALMLKTLIIFHLIFFGWFNLVTRPLWNKRAQALQS